MQNAHDSITVGRVTLPYSEIHHGWIAPNNNVTTNPITAQLLAEKLNSQLADISGPPIEPEPVQIIYIEREPEIKRLPLGVVVINALGARSTQ